MIEPQEQARALYVPGVFRYEDVARKLGVSATTIRRWLNPEEAERNRQQSRAAKVRRKGSCSQCGRSTSYDNENGRCTRCVNAELHPKVWTREAIIAAIQKWAKEHGRPPSAKDWQGPGSGVDAGYPATSNVYRTRHRTTFSNPFASWAEAIEAAGFERPELGGRYRERPHLWKFDHREAMRLLDSGIPGTEVARRLGVSPNSIYQLKYGGGSFAQRAP